MNFPWTGHLNWRALQAHARVLARRTGDRGEWLIAVGMKPGTELRSVPWAGPKACFGFAGYDLKNRYEQLKSRHPEQDAFALTQWWEPQFVITLASEGAVLKAAESDCREGEALLKHLIADPGPVPALRPATWVRTTPEKRYLERVRHLLAHIQRGDIYEVNYCTQRTAMLPNFDPFTAFAKLLAYGDAPFSAFLRCGNQYALCSSPERFLRKEGDRLFTQPMKGTRPRGRSMAEDHALAIELANDPKERSENIMALDVARNDLSRLAMPGTVRVDELCTVKSYPTVFQMVSTASATLRPGTTPTDILRATFPMASMTGAPKVRAMELIDEVEDMRRGLFSGTMGYFLPDSTADLNVVIRTVTWDAATGQASLISGGAITAGSTPEQEWAECEHKARSVLNAFGHAC